LTDARSQAGTGAVAAAVVGNALEWFDFTVFGLFAGPIGKAFFPVKTDLTSLLLALATFGVGFALRPLGALVLGNYADRAGRRAALSLIIVLMSIGTAIVVVTPPFAVIGIAAPVLIVAARLIQGFSVGGEMGGATAFLIESAPPERRGLIASWQFVGQAGAALAGGLIGLALTHILPPEAIDRWGWRIPFVLGLAIGPVGLYLRARMADSEEFVSERNTGSPIAEAWQGYRKEVAQSFGATILGTAAVYIVIFYTPTYAVKSLGLSTGAAFAATAIASLIWLVMTLVAGRLSDIVGRRRLLLVTAAVILIATYPLFRVLVAAPNPLALAAVQGMLAVLLALYCGPLPAYVGEMFPARIRATGLSLGYSVAVPVFGGFAPFIVAWLDTGSHLAPAYYLTLCAVLTIAALLAPGTARS
jgi:MHS family proline/betaine transporter-like MFS transporter